MLKVHLSYYYHQQLLLLLLFARTVRCNSAESVHWNAHNHSAFVYTFQKKNQCINASEYSQTCDTHIYHEMIFMVLRYTIHARKASSFFSMINFSICCLAFFSKCKNKRERNRCKHLTSFMQNLYQKKNKIMHTYEHEVQSDC